MGGRKPHGEVLVYKGLRYTWSVKGYWRCTSMGDRHNLTRRIWEEARGPILPGHKVIYLDGNRFNVALGNLTCLSHAEVQRRRMLDPDYKAIATCLVTYGRLVFAVDMQINPELAQERGRKIWDTRRKRFGPSGGNKKRELAL